MNEADQEIRTVVEYLLLEGLELSIASIQEVLHEKGVIVSDEQVAPILAEEGGPLPAYRGLKEA